MRTPQLISRCLLVLACGALLLLVGGCPKHEDFPTQLSLVTSPRPTDFSITARAGATGGVDYDLSWSVSDDTHVDHYRLYLLDLAPRPELLFETADASTILPINLPYDAQGLRFGVSSVSTGAVESDMATATVPAPQ
ncbi:MAG TPA: hypothetical protein VFH88_10535 [Candidatus Krumholzibacteria bacterium]|nr:hypothetical protein [Candidatus Krumholzibacteria bacterium]